MFRKTAAVIAAMTVTASLMPAAYANTFVNEAFAGSYLSAGATNDNYASLDILTCTDTSVSVNFKFVKNGNQQLIYECYEGTMNDNEGNIRFKVSYQDGSYVTEGTMQLTLDSWCVRLSCDSDQGQHLFDGIMYPQFTLDPYSTPTQPPVFVDTTPAPPDAGVTVQLNGTPVTFPQNVNPVILDDYTYVPLRSVFDQMGINVYWDEYQKNDLLKEQLITCTKNSDIVQFARTFNDSGYNVWTLTKWTGQDTTSQIKTDIPITDMQPVIIGSSSYVPLRVVSEAFGAQVDWDGNTKTVIINCDTSNSYKYDSETIGKIEDFSLDAAKSYITPDFTSVVQNTTPYFAADTKFYLFDATDQWNNVKLRISYGGYIDVTPVSPIAASNADQPTAAPTETVNTDASTATASPEPVQQSDTTENTVTE